MNENIEKLYKIAQKTERKIIGLMSGTSMDGLDVALCSFKGSGGETEVKLLNFETVSFSDDIKDEIRKVFAKKEIDFEQLCMLNPWIGNLHGQIVNNCLDKWGISNDEIDIIASHGQTVFHAPKILHKKEKFPNATLQIGDGDHIAATTDIITLSDFRQKHCAAGGEGAPLAVYGDYLIFSKKGEDRILLNMGGIANFTYLSGDLDANEVFATDTGTGNTLIDRFMHKFFDKPYDEDAKIARSGKVNEELLKYLKKDDFFTKPFPKTTGPELFSLDYVIKAQKRSDTTRITPEDLMATLTRFSAETIAEAVSSWQSAVGSRQSAVSNPQSAVGSPQSTVQSFHTTDFELPTADCQLPTASYIYTSGGGMHNPLLMDYLKELLPNFEFLRTDELGISGDAKEAVLFATLANEALCGGKTDFGSRRGVPSVSMGKVSFPR
jgi:anhydro-N-acetylmuramic acid kinase